jgi:hypothetical protein
MNYGNKQHSHRVFYRCNTAAKAWRFQSTVAFSGFRFCRRTRLAFTSSLRFFLAMADVSDPKINEGAFVNSIMMRFQFLTNPTAYEDVRSNKSDVNWVLVDYEVRP